MSIRSDPSAAYHNLLTLEVSSLPMIQEIDHICLHSKLSRAFGMMRR